MKPENVGKSLLPNNTIIYFDTKDGIAGYGKIVGVSDNPSAIIGYKYMVEPFFHIEHNQYTCIPVFEMWIDERLTKLKSLGI